MNTSELADYRLRAFSDTSEVDMADAMIVSLRECLDIRSRKEKRVLHEKLRGDIARNKSLIVADAAFVADHLIRRCGDDGLEEALLFMGLYAHENENFASGFPKLSGEPMSVVLDLFFEQFDAWLLFHALTLREEDRVNALESMENFFERQGFDLRLGGFDKAIRKAKEQHRNIKEQTRALKHKNECRVLLALRPEEKVRSTHHYDLLRLFCAAIREFESALKPPRPAPFQHLLSKVFP